MREFFRNLFRSRPEVSSSGEDELEPTAPPERPALAAEDDYSWLMPPDTVIDPAMWDKYWRDQITHGVAGFSDMFCDDGELVDAMRASRFRTVLFKGGHAGRTRGRCLEGLRGYS